MAEYVYLIWASQTDWYKIGVTTCPQSRLESLQTGTPTQLVFVSIMETSNAVVIEQFLLEKWQQRSADARGEWVKFHPWDLPEVFSDFRVSSDTPVQIPAKRPSAQKHVQRRAITATASPEAQEFFPEAPYDIFENVNQSASVIESALQMGFSKAWMCKELFGGIKPGGNKEYQEFQKLVEKAS